MGSGIVRKKEVVRVGGFAFTSFREAFENSNNLRLRYVLTACESTFSADD